MTYAIMVYWPRYGLGDFFRCLKSQTVPYRLVIVDAFGTGLEVDAWRVISAGKKLYWGNAMHLAWESLRAEIGDDDVVCFLNDDLRFGPEFFSVGATVWQCEVLVPYLIESGRLKDVGVMIDWRTKTFDDSARLGKRVDCFSPRGIFMRGGAFVRSGGFRHKLFPHYFCDYDFSMRLLRSGYVAGRREGLTVEHIV